MITKNLMLFLIFLVLRQLSFSNFRIFFLLAHCSGHSTATYSAIMISCLDLLNSYLENSFPRVTTVNMSRILKIIETFFKKLLLF